MEKYLFEEGVERGKTVVLLVDECQKLADPSLEILRTLLNYETNEYKILQLVMMGQMEFLPRISQMNNLWDRIAVKYVINPLDEEETRHLIDFRLRMAGYLLQRPLFDAPAVHAVYEYTKGYPRKISKICHDALEYLVMYGKERVDREIIGSLVRRDLHAAHTAGYLTAVNG
jgi:general secretion pathway protein A